MAKKKTSGPTTKKTVKKKKVAPKEPKFTVIRDTREKPGQGWQFNSNKDATGTIEQKLDTGDYTILGHEHLVVIERKGSIIEWATNVVQERFERELERLAEFPHAYILLEFNMKDVASYPHCPKVPRRLKYAKMGDDNPIRVSGPFILKRMAEMTIKYPTVQIMCVGDEGKTVARSIFKRVMEHYG